MYEIRKIERRFRSGTIDARWLGFSASAYSFMLVELRNRVYKRMHNRM